MPWHGAPCYQIFFFEFLPRTTLQSNLLMAPTPSRDAEQRVCFEHLGYHLGYQEFQTQTFSLKTARPQREVSSTSC